ncbi:MULTISPECIES: hypothetical protein [Kaistia]|jgi:hypothetical protein|uniref:DNA methyltransferase n=1 Tax=Kaistia defluvii TaxID=410841 RepID=A0ABV2QUL6_9HYPH|nr:hypothetical protein [Kaistia sp.]
METLLPLILQVVAGLIGGNAAGAALKERSLGTTGNSIAGGVGGIILGQILQAVMGGAAPDAGAAMAGMDIGKIVTDIVGGGAGGAILTAIIGMLKNQVSGAR